MPVFCDIVFCVIFSLANFLLRNRWLVTSIIVYVCGGKGSVCLPIVMSFHFVYLGRSEVCSGSISLSYSLDL